MPGQIQSDAEAERASQRERRVQEACSASVWKPSQRRLGGSCPSRRRTKKLQIPSATCYMAGFSVAHLLWGVDHPKELLRTARSDSLK